MFRARLQCLNHQRAHPPIAEIDKLLPFTRCLFRIITVREWHAQRRIRICRQQLDLLVISGAAKRIPYCRQ
jgi:hypothetical protein